MLTLFQNYSFRICAESQCHLLFFFSEKELLTMVRAVSEDQIYDTIEFNEFLQMMSKQQKDGMNEDSLKDAFR